MPIELPSELTDMIWAFWGRETLPARMKKRLFRNVHAELIDLFERYHNDSELVHIYFLTHFRDDDDF